MGAKLTPKDHVAASTTMMFRDSMRDDYVYDEYLMYTRELGQGFLLHAQLLMSAVELQDRGWVGYRAAIGGLSWQKSLPCLGHWRLEERVFWRLNSPSQLDHHRPRLYWTQPLIGPFSLSVSDEMRLYLTGERPYHFYRNRFFASLLWSATPRLTLGLGFARQWDRPVRGSWVSANALLTTVRWSF